MRTEALLGLIAFIGIHLIITVESVHYVRWGRTSCPPDNAIVYTGYAAGSWYNLPGGGANALCLPEIPEYGNTVAGGQDTAWLHGTEYEFFGEFAPDKKPFSLANNNGAGLGDNNVPCVVCFRADKTDVFMIPAKMNCPVDGMTMEYRGYMVANYEKSHYRTEFLCLDDSPESVPGMSANQNGNLYYIVQTSCASLKCQPYVEGFEAACVVCTM